MTKSLLLIAASAVLSFASFANAQEIQPLAVDNALVGAWVSTTPVFSNKDMTVHLGVTFRASDAVVTSLCAFTNGTKLEASVTVPVNAVGGKIDVLADARGETKSGNQSCPVGMDKGAYPYAIGGNGILKMSALGKSQEFKRK